MLKLKYRYCKSRMAAFINGELPLVARRRVARYIDECPDCYAEYLRQRDLAEELKRQLHMIGQPDHTQLNRIWENIQSDLSQPRPQRPARRYPTRYGLVAIILALVLMLPFILGQTSDYRTIPSQPAPYHFDLSATPTHATAHSIQTVALWKTPASESDTILLLQNTPEPNR